MYTLDVDLEKVTGYHELDELIKAQIGAEAYAACWSQMLEDHGPEAIELYQSGLYEMLTDIITQVSA